MTKVKTLKTLSEMSFNFSRFALLPSTLYKYCYRLMHRTRTVFTKHLIMQTLLTQSKTNKPVMHANRVLYYSITTTISHLSIPSAILYYSILFPCLPLYKSLIFRNLTGLYFVLKISIFFMELLFISSVATRDCIGHYHVLDTSSPLVIWIYNYHDYCGLFMRR